jgi:FdhE protein
LLAGTTTALDGRRVRRWLRRLLRTAAAQGGPAATLERADALDPIALLDAFVECDTTRLDGLATEADVHPAALRAVAPLGAMPLLQACGRAVGSRVPADWRAGYCPVCGAWPTLAEARGLERTRRLRCGRCGGDWHAEWLRCAFCDTTDHTRLGALVPENVKETRRVETCAVCHGYLKTLTTLTARTALEVALDDLATVALDVAALERGYARPTGPGHALGMRLQHARRATLLAWRR